MKRSALLTTIFVFILFASPLLGYAQSDSATNAPARVDAAKQDLFERFRKEAAGDAASQKVAFETAKEYLQKYGNDKDTQAAEAKEWMQRYWTGVLLTMVYTDKKYEDAFIYAKDGLTAEPENVRVLVALSYGGLLLALGNNNAHNAEAESHAKKAIELLESGKVPADWKPYTGKDETLGVLNFALGGMSLRSSPVEAINYLYKATQYDGRYQKDPTVYYYLAALYEQDFSSRRAVYLSKFENKPVTPESETALKSLNSILDVIIDAYARAIAYTDLQPALQAQFKDAKVQWMTRLKAAYAYRHNNSDAGLTELVSGILSKPIPAPPRVGS